MQIRAESTNCNQRLILPKVGPRPTISTICSTKETSGMQKYALVTRVTVLIEGKPVWTQREDEESHGKPHSLGEEEATILSISIPSWWFQPV